MLRIAMEEFSPRISVDSPRHSGALSLMIGGFSRKNFLYNKLPEQPLKLSVRKLDGSCFGNFFFLFFSLSIEGKWNFINQNKQSYNLTDIEVMKTATIAELRQAVEAAFSHMPKTGPGKISWYVASLFDWLLIQLFRMWWLRKMSYLLCLHLYALFSQWHC